MFWMESGNGVPCGIDVYKRQLQDNITFVTQKLHKVLIPYFLCETALFHLAAAPGHASVLGQDNRISPVEAPGCTACKKYIEHREVRT